jgi:16S rRNA (cytosine967-C5)-methyltransferase
VTGRRLPARELAVAVLRETLERRARASALLLSRGGALSPADHDLLRALVLGVLRHRAALDAELAAATRVPLPRLAPGLREILEVALYQIRHLDRVPDYAAVDEAVRHARRSGGEGAARLTNAVLRELLRRGPPARDLTAASAAGLAEAFSHPPFLVERWLSRFGRERTLAILAADNAPSGLDLMANPRRGSREELAETLRAEAVETEPSPLAPLGLTVTAGNPLRSPRLGEGAFTVQDVGSQALPLLLPPGETLVDLAAAPGGKSFAAVLLGRARASVAVDRSPERLRLVLENRRRLGVEEVRPVAADFAALPLSAGRFERVLFDAPCSGTGTLRKNPEIRYRVSPAAIERLSRAQEEGLAAAARLLAPGGYLLYSTCSLEAEENERVVERVLARAPELEEAPIDVPEPLRGMVEGSRFRIFPSDSSDGFTAHLIRRSTVAPLARDPRP